MTTSFKFGCTVNVCMKVFVAIWGHQSILVCTAAFFHNFNDLIAEKPQEKH